VPDRCYGPDATGPGPYTLTGDEAHHLARVRRAAVGDRVELFDGRGSVYDGTVRHVARDAVALDLGDPRPGRSAPFPLTLAVALPKGERLDWLVEKATELGVARLVPLRTARSTVDPRPAKLDRLRRLAIEASKQCGRATLMDLAEPADWADLLSGKADAAAHLPPAGAGPLRLLAHPGGVARRDWPAVPASGAILAIGPEGGFTDAEAESAVGNGWTRIGLGAILLRIETAALAGAALLVLDPSPHPQPPGAPHV
jgi:16S rRNA (uracil1498-N3)-methyltransferase